MCKRGMHPETWKRSACPSEVFSTEHPHVPTPYLQVFWYLVQQLLICQLLLLLFSFLVLSHTLFDVPLPGANNNPMAYVPAPRECQLAESASPNKV